jgi:hypothetical protein
MKCNRSVGVASRDVEVVRSGDYVRFDEFSRYDRGRVPQTRVLPEPAGFTPNIKIIAILGCDGITAGDAQKERT